MIRLGALVELNPGADPGAAADKFIRIADIDALTGTVREISPVGRDTARMRRRTREGDVLFARISPALENGKVAIVPPLGNHEVTLSGDLLVLRPRPGVDPRFVWAFLRQRHLLGELARRATGSAGFRRIDPRILMQLVVPRQQDARWEKELQVLEHLDKAVTLRRGVLQRARLVAGVAVTAATDGATPTNPLASRAEVRPGTPEGSKETGEVPIVSARDLRDGNIETNRLRYVAEAAKLPRLRRGDLLLARVGRPDAEITRAAVYEGDPSGATFSSNLIRIRATDFDPDYLWAWLQTEQARRACLETGSILRDSYRLTAESVRSLPVPVLPRPREKGLARLSRLLRRTMADSSSQFQRLTVAVQAHLEHAFPGSIPAPPDQAAVLESPAEKASSPLEVSPDLAPVFATASALQQRHWETVISMGEDFRTAEMLASEQERASVQHTLALLEQLGVVVREREGVIDHWRAPEKEEKEGEAKP